MEGVSSPPLGSRKYYQKKKQRNHLKSLHLMRTHTKRGQQCNPCTVVCAQSTLRLHQRTANLQRKVGQTILKLKPLKSMRQARITKDAWRQRKRLKTSKTPKCISAASSSLKKKTKRWEKNQNGALHCSFRTAIRRL